MKTVDQNDFYKLRSDNDTHVVTDLKSNVVLTLPTGTPAEILAANRELRYVGFKVEN